MTESKDYAVLRFFEQGEQCYKINDISKGKSILDFVKTNERIEKEEVCRWFAGLATQLLLHYKCVQSAYGYVNPYTMIVSAEDKILLLDMDANENTDLLKRMKKKSFRSIFCKEKSGADSTLEAEEDLFGFGQLLLFVVEKGNFILKFTTIEKLRLKKIIQECTEKELDDVERLFLKIQKELHRIARKHTDWQKICWKLLLMFVALMAGFAMWQYNRDTRERNTQVPEEIVEDYITEESAVEEILTEEKIENVMLSEEDTEKICLELGMMYYTEHQNAQESIELLKKIEDHSRIAQIYLQLFEYLTSGTDLLDGTWQNMWSEVKSEWERLDVNNKLWYYFPLMEAGKLKDTEESWNVVCEAGEMAEAHRMWNMLETDVESKVQICQYLGTAYEVLGRETEALEKYEEWKQIIQQEEGLKDITWKSKWRERYEEEIVP